MTDPQTTELNEEIAKIIDKFDWLKTHQAMTAVNWKWSTCDNQIPSIGMLVTTSIELLNAVWGTEDCSQSTGGFTASFGHGHLALDFCIEGISGADL